MQVSRISYLLAIIFFTTFGSPLWAQQGEGFTRTENKMRDDLNGGGVIEMTAPSPPTNKGSHYYDTTWYQGGVELFDGKQAENLLLRYELKYQQLEMIFYGEEKPRSIRPALVKSFKWRSSPYRERTFINPKLVKKASDDIPFTGFLEVLYDGKSSLYAQYTVELKEGYYVPIFDIGEKDNEWRKKTSLWIELDGQLYEFPRSRKKIIELFESHGLSVEGCQFRNYNYKIAEGARELVRRINELN